MFPKILFVFSCCSLPSNISILSSILHIYSTIFMDYSFLLLFFFYFFFFGKHNRSSFSTGGDPTKNMPSLLHDPLTMQASTSFVHTDLPPDVKLWCRSPFDFSCSSGKKFLSLLCPISFLLFDRPLTHKSFFNIVYFSLIPLRAFNYSSKSTRAWCTYTFYFKQ